MTAKIFDVNKSELMAISALERDGDVLVIRGKIYGAMPMAAHLRPEDVRRLLGLLRPGILLFLLTMPFRKGVSRGAAKAGSMRSADEADAKWTR